MYELCLAVWTMAVLGQYFVRLIAHEMTTMRTNIVALESPIQFLSLLGHFRRVSVSLDEKDYGHHDGKTIEQEIPMALATCGNAQGNGCHRDDSGCRTKRVELTLCYL